MRRLRQLRGALAAGLLAVGAAQPVSAQTAADRPFFDSLLVDFSRAGALAAVPGIDRCGTRTGNVARLCEGLIIARRSEYSTDMSDVGKARDLLERVVIDEPKWPVGWYALAMMRVQATRASAVSREGPLQPMGTSSEYGAGLALIRAISLDSSFTPAIEALAVIPTPREGAPRMTERLQSLRALRDRLTPLGKYGAGLVELEAGSADSALVWLREALRDTKIDRGMVRLAMARAMYRTGQATDGRAVLFAGANDTSTASRNAYRRFLSWVATPAEMAEWDSLKLNQQGRWFTAFWAGRDVNAGMSEGTRLAEHFRRFEFATKNYALREAQQGPQAVSSQARKVDVSRDEVSARYFLDLREKIAAQAADTLQPTAMMLTAAIAKGTYQAPFRSFRALRDKLDDRGVVYVRYGAPDKHEEVPDDGGAALWLYLLPDGPMTLAFRAEEFSGSTGPTRMVPHLLDLPPGARNKLCTLRPTLCAMEDHTTMAAASTNAGSVGNIRSVGGGNSPLGEGSADGAIIKREAEEGVRNIARATTTERFYRDFAKPLHPSLQVLALDQLAGGTPRMVIGFAVPGEQLAYTMPPEAAGKAVYPVRVQLALIRGYDGKRIDVDTVRVFASPKPVTEGEFLSGMIEVAVQPGTYTGSVTFSQDGGQGAVAQLNPVVVPDDGIAFALSNVVLGRAGGGVEWNSGTMRVPLNPLNTFKKGTDANVYFQLRGLTPGQSYELVFEFFKANNTTAKADFSVTQKETPTAERVELTKTVGFPSLDPGLYRLVLTVRGADGKEVKNTGMLTVAKQ